MRLLIIRGDLQSHSGYSSAAREYCGLLAGFFDRLAGVDIHQSSARPFEPFPYPLVSEAEARHLTRGADFALVLSFTTPDRYRRYDNAVNVGLTFWETDRLPLSCADVVNCMHNIRAVVPVTTSVADSDYHVFQDNEPVSVFTRLPLDSPRLHRALAIFTSVTVH